MRKSIDLVLIALIATHFATKTASEYVMMQTATDFCYAAAAVIIIFSWVRKARWNS